MTNLCIVDKVCHTVGDDQALAMFFKYRKHKVTSPSLDDMFQEELRENHGRVILKPLLENSAGF